MKVLIADDSAVIRTILEQAFAKQDDMELTASVSNGRKAIESAREKLPDIVISDIDMPEIDGLEATRILSRELHIPVLILAGNKAAEEKAMLAGAADFIAKPSFTEYNTSFFDSLLGKIRKIGKASQLRQGTAGQDAEPPVQSKGFKVLCLGASTGGPTAVVNVLQGLGKGFPLPILYAQHIEVGSDKNMADWLDGSCPDICVKLAEDKEEARPGTVYMAPADRHLAIDFVKSNGSPVLRISQAPPEHFLRPAVNVLFRSAAKFYKGSCIAVLLTGMGRDGADGCRLIRDGGGWTIAEDRSTCAVFGMPAAAIELGAASEVLPRGQIASRLWKLVSR